MPATYEPIASTTVSGASTVDFSSIPGTYTDMIVVISGSMSANAVIQFRCGAGSLNTTAVYSQTDLHGTGSSAVSYRRSAQTFGRLADAGSGTQQFTCVMQFMSYSNTNVFKTVLTSLANEYVVARVAQLFRSTSAIDVISIYPASNTFTGTVSLYGIKAA